jgi:Sec-independent protein translocase protein TatA
VNKTIAYQEDILLALDQLTQTMEVMSKVIYRLKSDLNNLPQAAEQEQPQYSPKQVPKNTQQRSLQDSLQDRAEMSTKPQKVH